MSDAPAPIAAWHRVVEARDPSLLDEILADEVVFRSPAVFTPQEGKAITTIYLTGALNVLGPTLTYQRQWYAEDSAVLEFTADLGGIAVHGVDMIGWGGDGRITSFTVMVRPFRALTTLMELMAAQLPGPAR